LAERPVRGDGLCGLGAAAGSRLRRLPGGRDKMRYKIGTCRPGAPQHLGFAEEWSDRDEGSVYFGHLASPVPKRDVAGLLLSTRKGHAAIHPQARLGGRELFKILR
jgi:hypothetical protein